MSIVAYVGLPGAGKSYGVVENVILPALKAKRHVVTNIPINLEAVQRIEPDARLTQLDTKCTVDNWTQAQPGAVIVIDEAWNWWPAGKTAESIPTPQKSFFAEHRHKVGGDGNSTEIILVVQDLANVSAFVRSLVEQTFRCEKLTSIGSKTRYRVDVYNGAVTGQKPPKGQFLRSLFGKYRPEIYALYKSHTQSKTGLAGLEDKADKRGTVFGSFIFKAACASLLLIPLAMWATAAALNSFKNQVTKGRAEQPAFTLPAQQPLPPPVSQAPAPRYVTAADFQPQPATKPTAFPAETKPTEPSLSRRWRITGAVWKRDGSGVALLKSPTSSRRIDLTLCQKKPVDQDLVCVLDGEIVTYYSGDSGTFASAALPPGSLRSN